MNSKPIVISRAGSSPAVHAKREVTLGVTPVSLRRFAYRARSRCHSRVFDAEIEDSCFIPYLHDGRLNVD